GLPLQPGFDIAKQELVPLFNVYHTLLLTNRKFTIGKYQRRFTFGSHFTEDVFHLGLTLAHYDGYSVFNDTGLLSRYALPRTAEKFLMIHPNICDHGKHRRDDVR